MPETTLIPYLACDPASAALDFYVTAFGARETLRLAMPDGKIAHAEMEIGGTPVMISDAFPEMKVESPKAYGGTPVTLTLLVADVDAVFARALAAGAKEERPVSDQFHGTRMGFLIDPFGHRWAIGTEVEKVSPEEMIARFNAMTGG